MPDRLEAQPQLPYQAYKSKRHSRNLSNPTQPPNGHGNGANAIARPRPSSFMGTPSSLASMDLSLSLAEKDAVFVATEKPGMLEPTNGIDTRTVTAPSAPEASNGAETLSPNGAVPSLPLESLVEFVQPKSRQLSTPPDLEPSPAGSSSSSPISPASAPQVLPSVPVSTPVSIDGSSPPPSEPSTSASTTPTKSTSPQPPSRRLSTFRHVPLRPTRNLLPSSPLRPQGTPRSASRTLSPMTVPSRLTEESSTESTNRVTLVAPTPAELPPPIPAKGDSLPTTNSPRPTDLHVQTSDHVRSPFDATLPIVPPPRVASLQPPSTTPPPPAAQSRASSSSTPMSSAPTSPRPGGSLSLSSRLQAPYRPGFQPKGVYRPRTDEFTVMRREAHESGSLRIERTKLERRLEKLILLHFPEGDEQQDNKARRPTGTSRRASSFFDLDISDLKSIDPGGLWKSVMMQGASGSTGKGDMRAAEQRITPWEDDSAVSKCPLCSASFHPLTNRKHHCRLCGKIICSLPVKHPQRSVTCSLLFVVDRKTRIIEEVSEGVDYGVRKRRVSTIDARNGKGSMLPQDDAEEKFLKGVRICRTCRPILTRQQFQRETTHSPPFVRLYEVFVTLEKEIEASLPQFEELLLSLTTDDHPTKEAVAARKRLLEAFAQYDALSKRIRHLPCPSGPGSSQDRVQLAVMTRANLFLQKHMFPLQTLPKKAKAPSSPSSLPVNGPLIDPDSKLAHALQPLLEQEALLESFIEEANAHRKFEDVKTLQLNLKEIRREIDRIIANAGDGSP